MASSEMIEKGATGVISHHVKENAHDAYEKWLSEIKPVCQSYPGHLDIQVIRPIKGLTTNYTVIIRFDTHAHLHAWIHSPERKRFIERVRPLLTKDDQPFIKSGLDFWFVPEGAKAKLPTRWKQALLTWSAIYPTGLIVPLILIPVMQKWGWPVQNHYFTYFIVSGVVVLIMVYGIMPHYTKLVQRWLFR